MHTAFNTKVTETQRSRRRAEPSYLCALRTFVRSVSKEVNYQ